MTTTVAVIAVPVPLVATIAANAPNVGAYRAVLADFGLEHRDRADAPITLDEFAARLAGFTTALAPLLGPLLAARFILYLPLLGLLLALLPTLHPLGAGDFTLLLPLLHLLPIPVHPLAAALVALGLNLTLDTDLRTFGPIWTLLPLRPLRALGTLGAAFGLIRTVRLPIAILAALGQRWHRAAGEKEEKT